MDGETKFYKAILDKSPFPVVSIDENENILLWNKACENFFGWTEEEVQGIPLHDLIIPPRFREKHVSSLSRYIRTGVKTFLGSTVRVPALLKNGEERSIELHVEDTSTSGEQRVLTAFVQDITEQLNLEKQADTNEKQAFESLFNTLRQSDLVVFSKDVEGRYTFMNSRALAALKMMKIDTSYMGKTDFDLFSFESAVAIRDKDLYIMNKAHPSVFTSEDIIQIQDKTFTYLTTRSRLESEGGVTIGVFCFSVDLTEYKQALLEKTRLEHQEILLREKIALANSRQKSEFLANMSHEIRTPLNGITSLTSLLLDTRLDEEQHDYVQSLKATSEVLMGIINDILDISKVEAGKIQLEYVDISLEELVAETEKIFNIAAKSKNIEFRVEYNVSAEKSVIKADVGRLQQILNNLLGNAVKFTFSGYVLLRVYVDSKEESLIFEISDTGIGVDAKNKDLLFKPFSQAEESTTKRFGGTGLGLSICKKLVELMKGNIGFKSTKDVGSTFYFSIPYIPGKLQEKIAQTVNEYVPTDKFILVVDDNSMNLKVAMKFVEKAGYKAIGCINGAEALHTVQTDPKSIGLILMDCFMPVMDGYEATGRIRQLPEPYNSIPIIAMTANALQGEKEHCLQAGMDDFITKPVDREHLFSKVSYWLRKKRV